MTEYDVKKALTQRSGKVNQVSAASQQTNGIPNSVLADVFSGKRGATSEMMGRRQDLAPGLAAKMSQSFGMDFSAVQLYRSDAMVGTELHGMAQGNKVVLSSDVDLNTLEGQAVLGHELSHIRAQSMGIGSGNRLLNDTALEHQADSEGLLAARGMNISGERMGMTTGLGMAGMEGLTPVGGGLGASAAAPMQAKKDKSGDYQEMLDSMPWMLGKNDYNYSTCDKNSKSYFSEAKNQFHADIGKTRVEALREICSNIVKQEISFSPDKGKTRAIKGLEPSRIGCAFSDYWAIDHSDEEILGLLADLTAGTSTLNEEGQLLRSGETDPLNSQYDEAKLRGVNKLKSVYYDKLKQLEQSFGSVLTQMHTKDIFRRLGAKKILYYVQMMQDIEQIMRAPAETEALLTDKSDDPKRDADLLRLADYYGLVFSAMLDYGSEINPLFSIGHYSSSDKYMRAKKLEGTIHGPRMSEAQEAKYNSDIQKKIMSGEFHQTPQKYCAP